MEEAYSRTALLIGEAGVRRLRRASVCIFGLGGVGSYAAEALARAGVGHLTLVDGDCIVPSNLNRQLYALHSTLGMAKPEIAKARILDINPDTQVDTYCCFYHGTELSLDPFDAVADCIDSIPDKLTLLETAVRAQVPVISCMGAGNRMDPSRLRLTDLSKTEGCPLAKIIRVSLRKRGITHLPAVWSDELPVQPAKHPDSAERVIGSLSTVPAAAGLLLASGIINRLLTNSES